MRSVGSMYKAYLSAEELGGRIFVCIVGGDMDKSVDIVFGDCFGDALCSLNMDVFESKIPEQLSNILSVA
jgi:uncharacterized protein (DUF1810 family)